MALVRSPQRHATDLAVLYSLIDDLGALGDEAGARERRALRSAAPRLGGLSDEPWTTLADAAHRAAAFAAFTRLAG
ncbi:MAG: hypothetical protein RLN63_03315 [Miltoncostaeaceae bacterium]